MRYECNCRICGDSLGLLTNEQYQSKDGLCEKDKCLEHVTPWEPDRKYQSQYAYACGYHN